MIVLRDTSGAEVSRRTIEIPADPLPMGSAWPFREVFRPPAPPTSVEASLVGNPAPAETSVLAVGEIVRTFSDGQGSIVALGRLTSSAPGEARLEALRLLGHDASGRMSDILEVEPASTSIGPLEALPFLARLPRGGESLRWEAYPILRPGNIAAPAVRFSDLESYQDDQGNPFVTAVARNDAPGPVWLTVTGLILDGDEWLGGVSASLPFPLAPGERLSMSLRVPRASLGLLDAGEVRWQLLPRTAPADGSPVPLASEVIGYEPVGSTLLLRIRLTGVEGGVVLNPSAYASITGDQGRVLSTSWAAGPSALGPGEESVVTLAIPLPAGFELEESELNIRAVGLPTVVPTP